MLEALSCCAHEQSFLNTFSICSFKKFHDRCWTQHEMLISSCILNFLGKDSRHTPFVCLVVCIILNNWLVEVGRVLWRWFVPSFGQSREFRSSCGAGYFLYSHAGGLPQSLHVLGIGLFLVLSLIIQFSWAPVTSRAVLPGTFPSRRKPESLPLESRIAVILLFILLHSGSWMPLTQPRLPLAFTSLTSFSLFE